MVQHDGDGNTARVVDEPVGADDSAPVVDGAVVVDGTAWVVGLPVE
ncbi:hypothetical protein DDB_G0271192 [Dictyostelium discoideum AX4]|uniref:Uncharacterized protein n=1 Tax=Dictyostelium discoideum TaxID=44689 RepID=Q55B64_DICDI|nr:hypothetical protein DDB_G0271192 [Dictyostelium discoideum AX4]EAL71726.1 hypothetical protein DDB_G0271192 [Dictyostelium discoideum AX4]|eukprot:XP_645748.1 hypothetical protein DDB_G0271192 [Dictyostelium discoideum AX4]